MIVKPVLLNLTLTTLRLLITTSAPHLQLGKQRLQLAGLNDRQLLLCPLADIVEL